MIKVITYGTYDLLHYGHIRLLERAKALGDYLIVGVTADDFDKTRGKINVQQSLMERVEAVRSTGIADEIIIEEYEGQKIDDIKRYDVDIFTVGSDWIGKFDYLNEYCKVVYLERTQGVSSSEIRSQKREIRLGLVGESSVLNKIEKECNFVNGLSVSAVYAEDKSQLSETLREFTNKKISYDEFLNEVDAVYIVSHPSRHYIQIKTALLAGKHVLCESPISLNLNEAVELFGIAKENGCVLMEGIKTAFSTAYSRLLLLTKSGRIGQVVSIDATCTSLRDIYNVTEESKKSIWNSICAWGPTAMLPIFQILGTDYIEKKIISKFSDEKNNIDLFTKIEFLYADAAASIKVGKGVKSEGELIISGTKGYIYVPAPWWKTDYFEIRYENPADNKRYFYQLDGEGIRYELVSFLKSVEGGTVNSYIDQDVSVAICKVIEDFCQKRDLVELR
jgi:choline-phosphate cytidylyltransferase